MNFHKKGEHVFNNFVQTIENMKDTVMKEVQVVYPHATKVIFDRSYRAHIGHIECHPIIAAGRQLKSLPSGEEIDINSHQFGIAAFSFQKAMCDLARSIVRKTGNPDRHKGEALRAWRQMADAGIDSSAYQRLITSCPMDKRASIEGTHHRMQLVLQNDFPLLGSDIVRTIAEDIQYYVQVTH